MSLVQTGNFVTTGLPKHRQALAGALIKIFLFLEINFFFGCADLVVSSTAHLAREELTKRDFGLVLGVYQWVSF